MRTFLLSFLATLTCSLALAGCGGEGAEGGAATLPDQARADQIEQLEGRVERFPNVARAQRRERTLRALETGGGAPPDKTVPESGHRSTSGDKTEAGLTALIGRLPGSVGVVVGEASSPQHSNNVVAGGLQAGSAWSTIKVATAERTLDDVGGPQKLSASQSDRIHRALQLSDNDAAASLFADLEQRHGGLTKASQAVEQILHRAGDTRTTVSTTGRDGFSTYGQTEWRLTDQWTYMASLVSRQAKGDAAASYLLDVMSGVGGSDTFGVGAIATPARWKGGWGPGVDGRYLVRQMGVIERPDGDLVVAMAAIADDGSFESGAALLSEIATWIEAHANQGE